MLLTSIKREHMSNRCQIHWVAKDAQRPATFRRKRAWRAVQRRTK